MEFPSHEFMKHWVEPLGLCVMVVVALMLALYAVRHHGRSKRVTPVSELRTALAFAVGSACVYAFARIAHEVVDGKTLRFDRAVALAVHRLDNPVLDRVMDAITFAATPLCLIVVGAIVVAWALRRHDYRAAMALVVVMIGSEELNELLKHTFDRPRPMLFEKLLTHSSSFPSGHAMAAVAIYGMLGIVLSRLVSTRAFAIAFPILIVLIGLSRIYLGVHWPTDVLAGWAAGGFLVVAGAISLDEDSARAVAQPA